ncbi:MAG: type ISP restriction/modification enzyme, partial [Bacteroidota bacterium]
GEDNERSITFAHFSENLDTGELPTLRVLGWDDQDTVLHLDHAHSTLKEKLSWPVNSEDVEAWRERWSEAFTLRHREVITTSKELAILLASLATRIRKRVNAVLRVESDKGAFRQLHQAFREALIHDLNEDDFADMYAQTITYGLLAARVSRPTGVVTENLAQLVSNPFLKETLSTFLTFGGKKGKINFDEVGILDVVDLLNSPDTNVEAVLRDFGNRAQREDPVIHFYELFLTEYDKKKKIERGVFYTPQPVVSYIVRSVHELLQSKFGLEDGLASTATWGEMVKRNKEIRLPTGVLSDEPFVKILDPAVGTGTFLVEVIDLVAKTMLAKWDNAKYTQNQIQKLWDEYVGKNLLPRLYGYELMMAPYVIADIKLTLKLTEISRQLGELFYHVEGKGRFNIYLTNSLEPPSEVADEKLADLFSPLAHEANAVNKIKRHKRFTVVIGNPPYAVSSWNVGAWITDLTEDYKRTVRGAESQIQSLSNDYIKFLRFGEWQIEQTRVGVLGMITGHGYLHGTQPRDLRNHLSVTFEGCYCLDLHGSIRREGTNDIEDEPVFQITTGVAIIVAFRTWKHGGEGKTALASLTGRMAKKFSFLSEETSLHVSSNGIFHRPAEPYFDFAPSETAQVVVEEYQRYLDLPEIFGTGNRQSDKEIHWATGFASQQDDLAMSFSRSELESKMRALSTSRTFDDLKQSYRLCTTNQWDYGEAKEFAHRELWREHVGQVAYRPFDRRWTVLHKHILTILRKQVMSQLTGTKERNIGLISSRAVNDLLFAHCFVTSEPVDKIFISSKTSTNAYVFPLFFKTNDLYGEQRRPNLSQSFLKILSAALGVKNVGEYHIPEGITPEDIFHYVYAMLHSPGYRRRYSEFLKVDFPHLPITSSMDLFRALAELGSELVALHLMESSELDKRITKFIGKDLEIEKVSYLDNTIWIDKTQTSGFKGVPENVWEFHVGGYQVCEKWLKDRKGRKLSKEDIEHYHRIVVALNETIRLMAEIDKVINEHGGWPIK